MKQLMTKPYAVEKKLLPTASETVIDMDDSNDASAPLNDMETALDGFDPKCPESVASGSTGRSRSAWKIAAGLAAGTGAGLLALSRYVSVGWQPEHGAPRPNLRDELSSDDRDQFDYINGTVRALQITNATDSSASLIDTENISIFAITSMTRLIATLPGFFGGQVIAGPMNGSLSLVTTTPEGSGGLAHAFLPAPFRLDRLAESSLPFRPEASVESEQQEAAVISEQEMAAEIELIEHMNAGSSFYVFDGIGSSSNRRKKRLASNAPIVGKKIKREIEKVVSKKIYPKNFIDFVNGMYLRVEKDHAVINALPESRDAIFILTFMGGISAFLKVHASKNNFNKPYNFAYLALKECWQIANRVDSAEMTARLMQYKNYSISEKWSSHKKSESSVTPTDLHVQAQKIEWKENDLRSDDRVAIHTWKDVRVYTMAELKRNLHRNFIGEGTFFSHFLFDHSGLPDASLDAFIEATRNRDLIEESAAIGLQDILAPLVNTPLYFQLNKVVQRIDHSMIRGISSGMETEEPVAYGKKIKDAMLALTVARMVFVELEQLSLASTDGLMLSDTSGNFSDMDIGQLVAADYVYHYDDAYGNVKVDTATLAEYLHRETNAANIVIAARDNVQMRWPVEFSNKLKQYLANDMSRKVEEIYARLEEDVQASQYREWLSNKIPSLQSMLESIVDEISEQENIAKGTIQLSDSVVFEYYHVPLLNSGLAANRVDQQILQYKSFSVDEILCGEKRAWLAKNIYFRLREDTSYECFFSEKISLPVLKKLQNFESQERLIQRFSEIRQDKETKQVFKDYVQLMEARIPTGRPQQYAFANAPLLRFYAQKDLGVENDWQFSNGGRKVLPSQGNEQVNRITVFSLRDGSARDFANFRELAKTVREDEDFRQFLRIHLLNDFDMEKDFLLSKLHLSHADNDWLKRMNDTDNLYDWVLDFEILNIDKIITSHPEATISQCFQIFHQISFFASLTLLTVNPVLGLSLGILLNAGPKALEAYVVDDNRERRELLEQAAWETVFQLGSFAAGKVAKTAFKAGFKKWLNKNVRAAASRSPKVKGGKSVSVGKKLPLDTMQYMKKVAGNREISGYIKNPLESCAAVLDPLGKILKDDGFTDIVYRGMLIWPDGGALPPMTHFVVMGKKNGSTLVFDLTAAQFKTLTRKLNKPLIVNEGVWKKKYKFISKDAVIRYRDFPSAAGAERTFDPFLTMGYKSTDFVEGTTLLTVPR